MTISSSSSGLTNRPEVRVVHRNRRWEVSVNGKTRPMIDWLCTKERAIELALERAAEVARSEKTPVTFLCQSIDGEVERRLVVHDDE